MKSFAKLRISGIDLNIEEITVKLGINPSCSYRKGETIVRRRNYKYDKNIRTTYEEDCWMCEIESLSEETPEMCATRLLNLVYPNYQYIKNLSNTYKITLWVSVYPDNEQYNFHLSSRHMDLLMRIGATLDISTTFLNRITQGDGY